MLVICDDFKGSDVTWYICTYIYKYQVSKEAAVVYQKISRHANDKKIDYNFEKIHICV